MQDKDWEVLEQFSPGVRQAGTDNQYWLRRSAEALAISTQVREIYPVMDHSRGQGSLMYDLQGNEYLDTTSGVAVRALGVRYPPLVEFEQDIAHVVEEFPGQDFDNIPQVLLAERLISIMPGEGEHQVFFTTSGARAVESAVKAAIDHSHKTRFVAFRPSFHGRTGYALALSASKANHRNYFPQALPVIRAPYSYCYRCPYNLTPDSCGAYCAAQVRDAIEKEGTDIAGIVVEPIAGEGGIIVSHPGFLPKLRAIATEYDAWLIVDEVQTGLGRTGKWWATEHFGVVPDAICSAKALGAGRSLGAAIGPKPLFSRASRHSETCSAEPQQALLSLFFLKEIEDRGCLENASRIGTLFLDALTGLVAKYDCVGDARGLGLMIGIEIVESKKTKTPAPDLRDKLLGACVHGQRLLVLGSGENVIRFLPRLNITEEEAREVLARLDRALAAVSTP